MATLAATGHRPRLTTWTLPLAALLLAAIVVLPPLVGINRFHRRIADSIGQGIGRPVRMSSVKMRLLPRPGFRITDFEVEEDPAFGAEPILRAAEVTAYVRLLALWRGRLEIARIAFDEPSVNLVRNAEGRWNFDSLLSQAAQIPKAPTGQPHAGSLPRFPYIDASDARINFKFGDEKMPFSFFNADLAVWLQNPGEWRVEFAAQPVRTDLSLDLANTGIVNIRGSLRRAPTLTEMPAVLHAEWTNAPLGQLSRLLAGSDANWRGYADFTADVTGSADHASVKIAANGRDLHRIEFEPREPLNLDVTCNAQFSRLGRFLEGITCLAPTGDGHLLLTGAIHANVSQPEPALSLEVNNLPVAMAFDGLRLVRSGFAPAAKAAGRMDGNFTYATAPGSPGPQLHGGATVNGGTIALPSLATPLALPVLRLTMNTDATLIPKRRTARSLRKTSPVSVEEPALLLQPFALGGPGSLSISGAFNRNGFSVHAGGESSIEQVVALGKELRLVRGRDVAFAAKGTTDVDVTVRGPWMRPVVNPGDPEHPSSPVSLDGVLTIRNAEATGTFLAQPLEIVSAQAVFGENRTNWNVSSLIYGPIHADGTLSYPVFCHPPGDCAPHFTMHLASLDAKAAQSALLGAPHHGELVQSLIDRFGRDKRPWPAMSGTVAVGALTIGALAVRDVDAAVKVDGAAVGIESLTGKALDGSLRATGTISALGNAPQYEMDLALDGASATSMAALFDERWGGGAFDLTTRLKFSGFNAEQLLASATGTFHWDWSQGGLPAPPERAGAQGKSPAFPLAHFDSWIADGTIANNALSLDKSEVSTGKTATPFTGTISFARELNLSETAASATPIRIAGTLGAPVAKKVPPAR